MHHSDLEDQRRTVTTSIGPISALDIGEGPVALFVHGIATNALLWHEQLSALGDCRRCVAIDLPLHGHTPAEPASHLGVGQLADAIEAFCLAEGIDRVDLVGHDTGGAVAQVFAARHPERIHSLCLTNCDAHDNVPPAAFKPTVDLAATGAISASAPSLLADPVTAREVVFGSGYEDVSRLDLDLVVSFLEPVLGTPERARRFEAVILALGPDELLMAESALASMSVPALIVWGTDDLFFDLSWAYWLRDLLPGADKVVEVDGGHLFFPEERADALIEALRSFWAGL
jgi:pimeloyl-ACP methyl ester carboxylesterase